MCGRDTSVGYMSRHGLDLGNGVEGYITVYMHSLFSRVNEGK